MSEHKHNGHDGHGHEGHGHHEPDFIRKYIFSCDHKMIGIQYLFTTMLMVVFGGTFALLIRLQLAWPDSQIVAKLVSSPDKYNQFLTMHASVMIFLVIIPSLVGAFGNFAVPLMIGAKDMAFPRLNMLSYWTLPPAIILMFMSFFLPGGSAAAGWTSYPPLTGAQYSTIGQTCWTLGVIIIGGSSTMGAINYIATTVGMRAPGMTMLRMPLFVWAIFITSILTLFATPVLASALTMQLLDRVYGTAFYVHTAGGQPLMYQHIFWFYSHPAVYIMILPAMGIVSDVLAVFSRKPIFGYRAMIYSICSIAGFGFIVWGHHMFTSGMSPTLGTTFLITTFFISVPSAVKSFNWLGTIWGGSLRLTTPMLWALGFVGMFAIGGLSGIYSAAVPVDLFIHDTYWVVAHIHYVLFGGSLMGVFAGVYFWFPKMFGRMMDEKLGKLHFWLTLILYNCVFMPMHILGLGGMQRRIYSWKIYPHLYQLQEINAFMTMSLIALGAVQAIFFYNVFKSLKGGEKAGNNPWESTTLEWQTSSPPIAHGNFDGIPNVYRGAYEYNSPLGPYAPQTLTDDQVKAIAKA